MNRRLRLKIIERFDSQAEFAKAAQIDESVLSRVIRERKTLSEGEMAKWAKLLSCSPDDIFQAENIG